MPITCSNELEHSNYNSSQCRMGISNRNLWGVVGMAVVSLQEAIELSGKSKSTIYRHVSTGKLSKSHDGFETSELIRVYGSLRNTTDTSFEFNKVPNDTDRNLIENESLKNENLLLRNMVEDLRQDKQKLYLVIEDYQRQLPSTSVPVVTAEPETLTRMIFKKLFG